MLNFYKKDYRIGLDVDEVCANFLEGYSNFTGEDRTNTKHFQFSYSLSEKLPKLPTEFWLSLPPKIDPTTLTFLPTVYISTRAFDKGITEEWLETNGFPCAPVVHVGSNKVEEAKKWHLDCFVDDYIKNFQELNHAGIKTLLQDCSHNRQYRVEPYRISSLYELPSKITELGW